MAKMQMTLCHKGLFPCSCFLQGKAKADIPCASSMLMLRQSSRQRSHQPEFHWHCCFAGFDVPPPGGAPGIPLPPGAMAPTAAAASGFSDGPAAAAASGGTLADKKVMHFCSFPFLYLSLNVEDAAFQLEHDKTYKAQAVFKSPNSFCSWWSFDGSSSSFSTSYQAC